MTNTPEYDQQGSSGERAAREGAAPETGGPGAAPTAGDGNAPPLNTARPDAPAAHEQVRPALSQTQPTVPLPEAAGEGYGAPTGGEQAQQQPSYAQQHQAFGAAAQPSGGYGASQAHQAPPAQQAHHAPPAPQSYAPQPAHHLPGAPAQTTEPPQHGAQAQPKSRTGALLAGLAIGALLGGVVGGGVAAVVASNVSPQTAAQGGGGAITLNNTENATAISGVAALATPSVVTLEVASSGSSGSGSGVIYREDGYIITNAHVVTLDGAATSGAQIRVKLSDGRILDGELVGVDPYADLAVVKVDADGLTAVQVADSDELDVGDLTVAIGAPLNLANTVTSGVVSALNRGISVGSPLIPQDPTPQEDDGQGDGYGFPWDFRFGLPNEDQGQSQQAAGGTVTLPVIQTDASINPGNSGGALLNGSGELIGINVAIASATSANGTAGSDGLGFAIPANLATRVADEIIAGDQPSHGLLGATVADSTQDTDEDANHAGGLLVELVRGGAAEEAGLRSGDVITAVDGVPAVDGTSVSALIRMHPGGSTITIDYTRGGVAGQVEVALGTLEW